MTETLKGYDIQEEIGKGGFGAVFRAYQPILGREVAIKSILPEYANRPEFIRRFETEAQLIARLEHPHIVPLYDFWREPDGAFLVMRWIRGGNLSRSLENTVWSLEKATRLLDQISSALNVAHRAGVIHRDIKPDNILIDEDGEAYLTDFGIAQVVGSETNSDDDGISGSFNYIAPEQLLGALPMPQTDIYSLGLVMYEALTGEHAFKGSTLTEMVNRHMYDQIPDIRTKVTNVPLELNEVLQKACAKEPTERYTSALEFFRAFRQAIGLAVTDTLSDDAVLSNPYKGLRAFSEADASDFHGRELLIDDLINDLRDTRFMAVVGPSGSGKSSVVAAGLLPALRSGGLENSGDWYIVEMVPGTSPLAALEAALNSVAITPLNDLLEQLRSSDKGLRWATERVMTGNTTELVVFIDQFEEVFTLCSDESERLHFLNLLTAASSAENSRLRVIVTLRADFYDRPLLYEGFGALMQAHTQVVLPMSADEIERAICQPATRAGAIVENDLVAQIVSDVRAEPGALPLLQYALTELFERREGRRLTLFAYRGMGGVAGALAKRADEVYDTLNEDQQALTRQVFLRLVTLGEGTEDTRRRTPRAELSSLGDVAPVLDAFGVARLLTFDNETGTRQPMVEVAHEALLRTWGRLRGWLDESRGDLRQQRMLASAAQDWANSSRAVDYVLTGLRLTQFVEWAKTTSLILTPDERAYLDTSVARQTERDRVEGERLAREAALERQQRTILRAMAGGALVGFVITAFLAAFAFANSNAANEARNEAQAQAATATVAQGEAIIQAATATFAQGQAVVAAQNAQDARATTEANADELRQALDSLRSVNMADTAIQSLVNRDSDSAIAFAMAAYHIAPDSEQVLRALRETAPFAMTRNVLQGHKRDVLALTFQPDAQTLFSASQDQSILAWNPQTGEQRYTLTGHSDVILSLAYANNVLASGDASGTIILWDTVAGRELQRLNGHSDNVHALAFTSDGTALYSASADGTVRKWDVATGEQTELLVQDNKPQITLALSADDTRLYVGTPEDGVYLYDLAGAEPFVQFGDSAQTLTAMAYDPVHGHIAIGDASGQVTVFDSDGQQLTLALMGSEAIYALVFNSNGDQLAAGNANAAVNVWDASNLADGLTTIHSFVGHDGRVRALAFNPLDGTVASGGADGDVRLWLNQAIPLGVPLVLRGHRDNVKDAAFSPDGMHILTGSGTSFDDRANDTRLLWWDWRTGEVLYTLEGHSDSVTSVAISADGKIAVSGSRDESLILWSLERFEIVRRLEGNTDWVWSVAISPDGSRILSTARDGAVIVWDAATGEIVRHLDGHVDWDNRGVFSADGTQVVTGGDDGKVILWDIESGEIRRTFGGHEGPVHEVAISPDGKTILSGSSDFTTIVWNVENGEQRTRLFDQQGQINGVSYSPDGTTYATGAGNGTILLWDATSHTRLQDFEANGEIVRSVSYSPDGAWLLASFDSGLVRVYALNDTVVMDWVHEHVYLRDFTCDERAKFVIEPLC